jgi:hypothetical protein
MKSIKNMTIGELAAYACNHLHKNGIQVVLSGGACVSFYSKNRYMSYDLDFIENIPSTRKKLKQVMEQIGFTEQQRYYKHPDTKFFIEFPPGPLAVGDEPVKDHSEIQLSTGILFLLSPTDCIKDRLAGYYHWNDKQCLEQALLVAEENPIDIDEIERWSAHEGKLKEFQEINHFFNKKKVVSHPRKAKR